MEGILSKSISGKGGRKLKVNKLALFIVILFALAYVFFTACKMNWQDFLIQIKELNLLWFFMAIFSIVLYWTFEAKILQRITFSLYGKYNFLNAFKVTMIGQFFNVVTPFASGGQPAQLYTMSKQKVGLAPAVSILMLKFIIYQTILTCYSLVLIIGKMAFFQKRMDNYLYLIIIGFFVNASVISLLFIFTSCKRIKEIVLIKTLKLLNKIRVIKDYQQCEKKVEDNLNLFQQNIETLKNKKKLLYQVLLYTIIQLTFFFIVPYFLYRSFKLSGVSIFTIISATAFVRMITSFVPIPGASGGAELSFYYLFSLFFLKKHILLAILLWRFISYYFGMLVGGVIMFSNQKSI